MRVQVLGFGLSSDELCSQLATAFIAMLYVPQLHGASTWASMSSERRFSIVLEGESGFRF